MKQLIKDIILENQHMVFPEMVDRETEIPLDLKVIVSLVGPRRSGKSWLLYRAIRQLKARGMPVSHILFLNFEDERLPLQSGDLDLIIQSYNELFPDIRMEDVWIFFDEIQNVPGWELFVRRLFDTRSRHLFITGSNARLLSTEIATALRGRTITLTVYPFSYGEYLNALGVSTSAKTQKARSTLIHYTAQFMYHGGFPETIGIDDHYRIRILQEYFNVMIFRDIVERYQVTNIDTLRFFIRKIFAGVSKPFSVNKAYNDLKSMGYKISNKYLYEYLRYCNDVFLCQSVSGYNHSEIKQAKSEKKAYIIDSGLLGAIQFSVSKDHGKLFENMVYMELLKQAYTPMYFKGRYECDFMVGGVVGMQALQATWSMTDGTTRDREFRGLKEACDYLGISHGIIITPDLRETIQYQGLTIEVFPFYELALKGLEV
ncbi:MAG TPA: ATP-binding protein [Bacteroidales bacterium]|nr:ATP-binding protein [Bacteroidales bacterium]HRZ48705.1 ATP-binding protein [Bacteroidales bacterium]